MKTQKKKDTFDRIDKKIERQKRIQRNKSMHEYLDDDSMFSNPKSFAAKSNLNDLLDYSYED